MGVHGQIRRQIEYFRAVGCSISHSRKGKEKGREWGIPLWYRMLVSGEVRQEELAGGATRPVAAGRR